MAKKTALKSKTTTRRVRTTAPVVAQPVVETQPTSYGPLALVLALLLVAVLFFAFGGYAAQAQVAPKVTATVSPTADQSTGTPVAKPVQLQECRVINDYQLQDLPELSVEDGGFLHVEWYVKDGDPERESALPSGRYLINTPLRGHVWEYSPACSPEQVLEQVAGQITRRKEVGANNAGFAPWQEWLVGKGLIEIVRMTSTSVIPTALPNPTK